MSEAARGLSREMPRRDGDGTGRAPVVCFGTSTGRAGLAAGFGRRLVPLGARGTLVKE